MKKKNRKRTLKSKQTKEIRERLRKTKKKFITFNDNFLKAIESPRIIPMLVKSKITGGATLYQPFELDIDYKKSVELPYFESDSEISQYINDCLALKSNKRQEQLLKDINDFLENGNIDDFESIKFKIKELFSIDSFGTYLKSSPRIQIPKGSPVYRAIKLYENDELKFDFDPVKWRFVNPRQSMMRLNDGSVENAVLYGSPEFHSVFYEVDAKDENEKMAVFIYTVKKDLELLSIDGKLFSDAQWGSALNRYGSFLNELLSPLFSTKIIGNKKEDLVYKLSNFIKDEYYNLKMESGSGSQNPVMGWTYISTKTSRQSKQVIDTNSISLKHRCFAFPKEFYEECLDLDNVMCVMVNCTDEERRQLMFCQEDYVKGQVMMDWNGNIIKEYE